MLTKRKNRWERRLEAHLNFRVAKVHKHGVNAVVGQGLQFGRVNGLGASPQSHPTAMRQHVRSCLGCQPTVTSLTSAFMTFL
jgi:hypothetical protein